MLLQFNFKNFKSFRDDTTLDLSATKISEYSERVATIGNERILPVAAIFGANAHGKSNIIEALRYMHYYVTDSFAFGGDSGEKKTEDNFIKPTPFLFDSQSKNSESLFEIYFIDSEEDGARTYNYGFTVDSKGINEEWLNYKTKSARKEFRRIFYRNNREDILDLSGISPKSQENVKIALENEALIVSLGSKLKITKLKHIRDWFLKNEFADFGEPIENFILSRQLPKGFADNKEVQEKVVRYLSSFDESIKGFNIKAMIDNNGEKTYKIETVHKMVDSNQDIAIPLSDESSGTLKMFSLYPMLQEVLEVGGVFFVDELNARLHPLLVRTFIITFLNPEINKNNAQLVFTSHNTWQLSGNGLRRDEIWFTDKDHKGISTLYSLADFVDEDGYKIRKDENYEKNYLLGKYGAIPSMKYFNI
ncbi:MAG: ATP-binding protein [Clostridiales bacterium]|nr:ATP-binding protein [Clostridiales bacterium]